MNNTGKKINRRGQRRPVPHQFPCPQRGRQKAQLAGPQRELPTNRLDAVCQPALPPHSFPVLTLVIITNPGGADARECTGYHGMANSKSRCLAGELHVF